MELLMIKYLLIKPAKSGLTNRFAYIFTTLQRGANLILFLTLIFMLCPAFLLHSQQVGIDSVVVTFVSPPSIFSVTKAPLKYNKDFSFGMHLDDGAKDIYTHAYPFLNSGTVQGVYYPGLKYTDGCGNDIYFKMSSSIFSFFQGGTVDGHDPNGPYANMNVTWPELVEMYQDGWGIYNHGLTSSNTGDIDYSIARNHSYVKRKTQAATEGGVDMKVFVNPNGDEAWTTPAFEQGYIVAYRQYIFGVPSFDVTSQWVRDTLKMGRTALEGVTSLSAIVNNMAALSINGAHHWGATFSHSVTGGFGYTFNVFKSHMNYIAYTYGKDGLDNVWMTTEEETLNYLVLNELITVNTNLTGNVLVITFSGNLPTDIRFYALSLIVNSDVPILMIDVYGGTSSSYNGLFTTQSLINLNWDGKIVIPDTVNAETYVSIAEQTQTQNDANIAMDYVEMVDPGPAKEAFRERLCAIPGVIYPEGYCNCVAEAGNDTTICNGECVTLTASEGVSYLWSTGDTTQSIFVCPVDTTEYFVTVTNNVGCPATDSVMVNVNPVPIPEAGNDTTICNYDCITLTASGGVSYLWSTGDTTASILVCPSDTTIYSVTVTNEFNCSATDSVTVNVNPSPNANAGNDTTICNYDCASLTASGEGSYLWNTGDTTASITVCPQDTTIYSVTVTNIYDCSATDSVTVNVTPTPIVELGNDTTICQFYCITLTVNSEGFYLWSTGDTTQSIIVCPSDTTEYTVIVTNNFGCFAMDSITINVKPSPTAELGNDTAICQSDSITLTVIGDGSYLWSTGDTTQSITVSPPDSTRYFVSIINNYGCSAEDSILITVNPYSDVSFTGLLPAYCDNSDSSILTGDPPGGEFLGPGITDSIFYPDSAGSGHQYIIYSYTNEFGCVSYDTNLAIVYAKPIVNLGNDTTICNNKLFLLTAGDGFDTYLWSNGNTWQTITINPDEYGAGFVTFSVIVTKNGCAGIGSITLNIIICNPGIDEIEENLIIKLFPNPTSGQLFIQINGKEKSIYLNLINIHGKVIYKEKLINCNSPYYIKILNLSDYPSGMYFIKFSNSNFIHTEKILIN